MARLDEGGRALRGGRTFHGCGDDRGCWGAQQEQPEGDEGFDKTAASMGLLWGHRIHPDAPSPRRNPTSPPGTQLDLRILSSEVPDRRVKGCQGMRYDRRVPQPSALL